MKLVLADTASGYDLSPLNNNFNLIESELQNKVLYRNNPAGEPNQMENDLDLNNNNLQNVNLLNGEDVSALTGNLTTVANLETEINTVAGISTQVQTVAGDSAAIQAVNNNLTDINAVSANETDIKSVAANEADIDTVALNITSVNNVSANISNVNTVATNETDVNTVATNISDVQTVSTNITATVNVSDNIQDVRNYADTYLGSKASDPTVRNDGTALQVADLYFNTSINTLKIYDGSAWINGAFSAEGATGVTYDNTSSGLAATDVQSAIDEVEARTDTAEADIDALENTTSSLTTNIAPSIQSGAFNPESATLVWSGNDSSILMTALSEQGAGWYIMRDASSATRFSVYVHDDSLPAGYDRGTMGVQLSEAGDLFLRWGYYSGVSFRIEDTTVATSGTNARNIDSIWKV